MIPPLIRGPVPAESNPPINPQFYKPSQFQISAIQLGSTTLVTTSIPHNYVIGQLVRLVIPSANGSYQLNETSGYVIEIPTTNEVVYNVDSTKVDTFVPSSPSDQNVPQIMAIGDINSGILNANGRIGNITYIPGSFINISPQ